MLALPHLATAKEMLYIALHCSTLLYIALQASLPQGISTSRGPIWEGGDYFDGSGLALRISICCRQSRLSSLNFQTNSTDGF